MCVASLIVLQRYLHGETASYIESTHPNKNNSRHRGYAHDLHGVPIVGLLLDEERIRAQRCHRSAGVDVEGGTIRSVGVLRGVRPDRGRCEVEGHRSSRLPFLLEDAHASFHLGET